MRRERQRERGKRGEEDAGLTCGQFEDSEPQRDRETAVNLYIHRKEKRNQIEKIVDRDKREIGISTIEEREIEKSQIDDVQVQAQHIETL